MAELISTWFQSAQDRWPSVRWTLVRFGIHVGDESPRHPLDLFLGGAASEWLDSAWTAIYLEFRPEVLRRVARIARRGEPAEDLWSEAVAKLMSEDSTGAVLENGRRAGRIRRFRGSVPLPSYIAVIAKRIAVDKIRRDQVAMQYSRTTCCDAMAIQASPDEVMGEQECARRFAEQFGNAFAALPPLRQALLSLVFGPGMAKADAGRILGLRDYEVSREIKASVQSLRDRLEVLDPDTWSIMSTETWTRAWTELRVIEKGDVRDET